MKNKLIQAELDKRFSDLEIDISKNTDDTYYINIYNTDTYSDEVEINNITKEQLKNTKTMILLLINMFDFSYHLEFEDFNELDNFLTSK